MSGDSSSYPCWKLVFIPRFEEYDTGVLKDRVPPKATKSLDGIKDDGANQEAVPDPDKPGRFLIRSKTAPERAGGGLSLDPSAPPANPLAPDASKDGLTGKAQAIIPLKFELRRNGIRTPDELNVTLSYYHFPFDPRMIRACAVEFYLGSMTARECARAMRAEPGSMAMIADTYLDSNGNQRTNRRFQGWVETYKMTWNDDEPLVELQCRDNTQILQNQLAPPKLSIAANKPLDEAIATYLSNFPQCLGLTVEYLKGPDGESAPIMDKVLAGTAFRPGLGPTPAKGASDSDDLFVWDYITDVCGALGLVCYVVDDAVVIARPFTVLGGAATTRATDPYVSRKLPDGEFPIRTLAWGKNLESFEASRDFAQKEAKNIELRSYSPRRKSVLVARYPEKEDRVISTHVGDSSADHKFTVIRVHGVEDATLLKQMAKDYYSGRMRSEIEVTAKTSDLYSYGGDAGDPDLLDVMPTDPIAIINDRDAQNTMGELERRMTSSEDGLAALGYDEQTARAYVQAANASGFQRVYRVSEVTISGEVDEGVGIEIKAKNFIQVRAEKAK